MYFLVESCATEEAATENRIISAQVGVRYS